MPSYTLSLLDRLFDDAPQDSNEDNVATREFPSLREAVSRDIENLLNTRSEFALDLSIYPELSRSVLTYGLPDFSHMSSSNPQHRKQVCEIVADVIARFEPRLKQVTIQLATATNNSASHDFFFQINALLLTNPEPENIVFDAVLETSTQRYRVID